MRLRGARGALSTSLDVPAELETAVTAALGDTLDAILLDSDEVENALQLLESEEAGRAALLPLDGSFAQAFSRPGRCRFLGIASELVNAPAELRLRCRA
jgi:chromosome segregation ATPase